jgi:uncharacterized protein (DUF1015 family)
MVDVRPFRGLRFDPSRAPNLSDVLCPPYDVISPAEQRRLYARHPHNVVRLELGLEQPGDDAQQNRYTRAANTLAEWQAQGVLLREPLPAVYLHQERFTYAGKSHERRDLLASVRLSDWSEGQVLPHEKTMSGPKEDRFRLLCATATQLSPVFALYSEPSRAVAEAWARASQGPELNAFIDDEGHEHRLWALTDERLLSALAADFSGRKLYIADGHHRYETALRYRDLRREESPGLGADAPFERVLMLLTAADDPGLLVLPTHRVVHGGPPLDQAAVEQRLSPSLHLDYYPVSRNMPVEATATVLREMERSAARFVFGMYGPDPGLFTVLTPREEERAQDALPVEASSALKQLDVVVLHALVVWPLVGKQDEHEHLTYTRDVNEAFRLVGEGQARLALFLNATRVEQIIAVAEAGDRMPEKSTYFYPKPPTGMVLYPLA